MHLSNYFMIFQQNYCNVNFVIIVFLFLLPKLKSNLKGYLKTIWQIGIVRLKNNINNLTLLTKFVFIADIWAVFM